jgi:hypothetical protein
MLAGKGLRNNSLVDSFLYAGLELMDRSKSWVSPCMITSIFIVLTWYAIDGFILDCSAWQFELSTPLVKPRPPSPLIGSLRCGSLDSLQDAHGSERPQSDISDDGKPVLLNCVLTYLCFFGKHSTSSSCLTLLQTLLFWYGDATKKCI